MRILDGISASEGYLNPPDTGDRHCTHCNANVDEAPNPLHVECDETVNTDEPRCASCCIAVNGGCPDCCQFVGEWLTDAERVA